MHTGRSGMKFRKCARTLICSGAVLAGMAFVQQAAGQTTVSGAFTNAELANERSGASSRKLIKPVFDTYYSQADGISLDELVAKALASNGEIRIARLEADKARARRFQAGSRRNPTLDVEQAVGSFVGDSGEGAFTVGAALPLDLYGVRVRRIQMAEADIAIREAEIAAQQRAVVAKVLDSYSDALSVFRELQVLEELLELDTETARIVQIRVNEGETPPLELNLLQAEVERLRARRSLIEGRLQAALSRLSFLAGFPPTTPIRLKEDISTARLPYLPASLESGIASALNERPEIRLALLEESLAAAGLRLAKAQGKPELSATTKFSYGRSVIDDPRGPFDQRDRSLSFGVSVSIPVFDRNQGAKAEAEIAIRQAQERKVFAEQIVKSEVAAAFRRVEASRKALNGLQNTVLPMSLKNIETVRKVYEIGELKVTDLIAEQRRLLETNNDLTETLTEFYKAQADLFIAVGLKFKDQ